MLSASFVYFESRENAEDRRELLRLKAGDIADQRDDPTSQNDSISLGVKFRETPQRFKVYMSPHTGYCAVHEP